MKLGGDIMKEDVRRWEGKKRKNGERRKDRRIKKMKKSNIILIG